MARPKNELLTAQISALVKPGVKEFIDFLADDKAMSQGDVIRACLDAGLTQMVTEVDEDVVQAWRAAKAEGREWKPRSAGTPKVYDGSVPPEHFGSERDRRAAGGVLPQAARPAAENGVQAVESEAPAEPVFVEPVVDHRAAARGY